jgi:AcrR family transcriptional regulator
MPASHSSAGESSSKVPYHHGNLREALIEAAIALLAESGASGLGLRCTARTAGVSASAPYHHFGGKQGLLAAVAAEGFRRLAVSQEAAEREESEVVSPRDRVKSLGRSYIRFARAHPELYELMFFHEIEDRADYPELVLAAEAGYERIERATMDLLATQGEAAVPPKVAINGAWAMVHGLSNLLNEGNITPGEKGNPDESLLIDSILEIWARGLDDGLAGWSPPTQS